MSAADAARDVAAHVLWHYGESGHRPGSFTVALLSAIASADPTNRRLLALGFPHYVAACDLAEREPDGIEQLRRIAAGEHQRGAAS